MIFLYDMACCLILVYHQGPHDHNIHLGCMHPALYTVLTFILQLDSASKVPSRNLNLLEQSWHASRGPTKLDWQGGKTELRLNDWKMADLLARNLHGGQSWRCKTY